MAAKKFRTALIIDGDSKGAIRATKATDQQLAKLDKQQKLNSRSAASMTRNWAKARTAARSLALGVGAAAVGVLAITNRSIAATMEANTLAKAIGVSTGEFQAFQYAAEQAGIGADKAGDIIKDISDKIGDASLTGGGELADVLDRIGLSAEELQKSGPVEQLVAISGAIKDLPKAQQVTVMEAIADDATRLLPLMRDNAKLLRQYSKEAKDFGISLGDDDVARLLAAQRATARFSGAMRGLGNDIAIAVAPALTSSIDNMDYLRDIVGDSGFQQNLATLASAFANTAGFLAEGTREYVTLGQQIGTAAAHLAGYSNEIEDIDAKITRLQSIRGSSVLSRTGLFNFADEFDTYLDDDDIDRYIARLKAKRAKIVGAISSSAASAAQPTTLDPIEVKPGRFDKLTDQYDKAHVKLEQLRKDRVRLQQAIAEDPANADAYRRPLREVNRQIDGLAQGSRTAAKALTSQQRAAKQLANQYESTVSTLDQQIALFGETGQTAQTRYDIEHGALQGISEARKTNLLQMSAEIDRLNAQKTAVQALFPEFQKLQQASQLRQSVADLPPDLQQFGKRRAAQLAGESATQGLPGGQGLDPQFNGPFGEADRLEDERAKYQEKYQQRLEAFQAFARTHQDQKAEADAAIEALEADHQQRMQQYDDQTAKARRVGYEDLYGSLTDIVGQFAGRQSGIYSTLFAAEKAYHFASVLMSSTDAIAKAWASAPFPANLPAVATTVAETGVLSAAVSAVGLSGQAHDGLDNVPREGTWLLDRGERVVDRRTNVDLKKYLAKENTRQGGDTAPHVSITVPVTVEAKSGMSDEEARRQGAQVGDQVKSAVLRVIDDQFRPGGRFSNVKRSA